MASPYQDLSAEERKRIWAFSQYRLTLDQAMLMGLEDTARWYLQQSGESRRPLPNFIKLIDDRPLRAVRPEAVQLSQ